MSDPPCDGRGIVVLGNITTPGMYPAGVQGLLDAHPGAYYLRTDQSCAFTPCSNSPVELKLRCVLL